MVYSTVKDHDIDPGLCRVLLSILKYFPTPHESPTLSSTYQSILASQLSFTPFSVFRGHFVSDWVTTQEQYCKLNNLPRDRNQSRQGIVALGRLLTNHVATLWSIRNQQLHESDPNQQMSHKRLMLLAQLESLYDQHDKMLYCDRPLLSKALDKQKQKSNRQIKNFIKFSKLLIKNSVSCAATHGFKFKPINKHFPPIRTDPPKDLEALLP